MYMKDWAQKLNAFLKFNEREILQGLGEISNEVALSLAEKEFTKFTKIQDSEYVSDFDMAVNKLLRDKKD